MQIQNLNDITARALGGSLASAGFRPYRYESGDPTRNAQRNLEGRTHFADPETLKWHKARITGCRDMAGGLFLRVTESVALDMNNRARGFRCVVFDIFGTTVYRPDLDNCFRSSEAAQKAAEKAVIDGAAHYREAVTGKLAALDTERRALSDVLQEIAFASAQQAA